MNPWDRYVLPKLIDVAMRSEGISALRSEVVPRARGRVLEIGMGSALNLRHYGPAVTAVIGVEPSVELVLLAQRRIAGSAIPIEVLAQSGEQLPLPDHSIDTVVFTWTLCSIPNVYSALRETFRVLKPRGEVLFAEHGEAPDRHIQQWQHRIQPAWKTLTGGCHLTRAPDRLLGDAGFRVEQLTKGYVDGPKFAAFMYRGVAVRPR